MACIDEGEGDAIVFQHGNPTSSYLWRNVMPHCRGLGRLVACDLIGMGDSDKLAPSGPERYTFAEQREYLHALWDALDLGDRVVLVLHDWGSALGFDWAKSHRERVQGIAYMEGIVTPVTWADWPDNARKVFQNFRSPAGEEMVLQKNVFVERVLPGSVMRGLTDEEMAVYRSPFASARRGPSPDADLAAPDPDRRRAGRRRARRRGLRRVAGRKPRPQAVRQRRARLDPHRPRSASSAERWPNQTEVTVKGTHFIQEDSPDEIGSAVAAFVRRLRGRGRVNPAVEHCLRADTRADAIETVAQWWPQWRATAAAAPRR